MASLGLLGPQNRSGFLGLCPVLSQRALYLVSGSAMIILKFLTFEKRALHFHIAVVPANYIAGPAWVWPSTRSSSNIHSTNRIFSVRRYSSNINSAATILAATLKFSCGDCPCSSCLRCLQLFHSTAPHSVFNNGFPEFSQVGGGDEQEVLGVISLHDALMSPFIKKCIVDPCKSLQVSWHKTLNWQFGFLSSILAYSSSCLILRLMTWSLYCFSTT